MDRKLTSCVCDVTRVLGVLLYLGVVAVTAYDLGTKPETMTLTPGEQATLPCILEGDLDNFNFLMNPITFYKGKDKVQITNNAAIKPPFLETGRYSARIEGSKWNEVYLTLQGVTGAESDTYTCEVQGGPSVTHTVIVPEPIESVILESNNSVMEGGERKFLFEANVPSYVSCDVKGGRPKPKVKIYMGEEEITDQFEEVLSPTVELGEGVGLEVTKYQAKLTKGDFTPGTTENGKEIKCKARIGMKKSEVDELSMDGLTKESSAKMEIRFPPEFECDHEAQSAMDVDSFELKCKVRAYPQIIMETIEWSFGPEGNKTYMLKDDNVEGYETYATVNEDTGNVDITLNIKVVGHDDFMAYNLKVENDIGIKEHEINFFLKTTTDKPPAKTTKSSNDNVPKQVRDSGSTRILSTLLSLAISMISAIVLL